MEICKSRYATKKFDGKIIPDDKIKELLEMIKLSASSFGLQPFKVQVISDQETKDKLLPASHDQVQVTTCSHLLVFHTYKNISQRIEKYGQMMKENNAPENAIEMLTGYMNGFAQNLDGASLQTWATKQIYIALGNALNGAKALGLDSCPMEGFDSSKYAQILNTTDDLIPTVLCPVGFADDKPKPKIRFSDEELFF